MKGLHTLLESDRYELYVVIGQQVRLIDASIDFFVEMHESKEAKTVILDFFEEMERLRNQIIEKMQQYPDRLHIPPNFTEEGFREFFGTYQTRLNCLEKMLEAKPKKKKLKMRI